MKRGLCVKCGAATVRAARNGIQMGDRIDTLLRPHVDAGSRGATRSQSAELWAFGCFSCGYVELYVLDAASRDFMKKKWAAVAPEGASTPPPPPPAPPLSA